MKPFVSVVIPCRNEAATLSRCLDSILTNDYPASRMEVIVADGCSQDSSRALLAHYLTQDARVRCIDNPERITPIALNRAIAAAHGDYILRVDAHSVLDRDYIPRVIEFLQQRREPEIWGAGGQMITVPASRGPFADAIREVLAHRFGVGNSRFRTDAGMRAAGERLPTQVDTVFNCCWRREVFTKIGLFHPELVRSQDIEFSSRIAAAGGTLWLVPEASTTYFAKSQLAAFIRHNWNNGVWSILPAAFLGRLPVRLRHLVPLLFVGALLTATLLAAIPRLLDLPPTDWPPLGWLPLVVAGPYAVLAAWVSVAVAWRQRRAQLVFSLPIAFAGLHLAYGAGSVWGCARLLQHHLRGGRSSSRSNLPLAREPATTMLQAEALQTRSAAASASVAETSPPRLAAEP